MPTVSKWSSKRASKLVPCPCCRGPVADARPEQWYFDLNLVKAVQMANKPKGTKEWQCRLCKNKRVVRPDRAVTFVLSYL